MKIFACNQGDMSVGIPPLNIEIKTNSFADGYDSVERGQIKQAIKELMLVLDEPMGRIDVDFEDECFNCGSRLEKVKDGYKPCNKCVEE